MRLVQGLAVAVLALWGGMAAAQPVTVRMWMHEHPPRIAIDKALIAKSNSIRRENGPVEDRRQTRHPIRTRPTKWPKRAFQSRKTT